MCCGHDPFFQASWCSLAYQFTINASLMCPPPIFNFKKKICFFSLYLFWPKFQLSRCIFLIFVPKTTSFFKESTSLEACLAHTHQKKKKKLSAPPPPAVRGTLTVFCSYYEIDTKIINDNTSYNSCCSTSSCTHLFQLAVASLRAT